MGTGNDIVTVEKTKLSDLWKKEDWLAVWIGVILIAISAIGVITGAACRECILDQTGQDICRNRNFIHGRH